MNYTEEKEIKERKRNTRLHWATLFCSIAGLFSLAGVTYLGVRQEQIAQDNSNNFSLIENKIDSLSDSLTEKLLAIKDGLAANTLKIEEVSGKIDALSTNLNDYYSALSEKIEALKNVSYDSNSEIKALQAQSDAHAAEAKALLEQIKAQNDTDTATLQAKVQEIIDVLSTKTYKFADSTEAGIIKGNKVTCEVIRAWDCDHQNDGYFYADTNRDEKWTEDDFQYSPYLVWNATQELPHQDKYFGYMLNQLLASYPAGNPVISNGKYQGKVMGVGEVYPHGDTGAAFTYTITIQDGLSDYIQFADTKSATVSGTWQNGYTFTLPQCEFKDGMVPQSLAKQEAMAAACAGKLITFDFE